MNNELKFFTTRVSPNRNYTEVISSGTFCIKKEDLDYCELRLLNEWFRNYSRNASRPLGVVLETNSENGVSYLSSEKIMGEVYTNPELLQNRIEQLHQIEADFFKQIAFIKQPKF